MSFQLFSIVSPKVEGRPREEWKALIGPARLALAEGLERCASRDEAAELLHRLVAEGRSFERALWTELIVLELAERAKP
jgi:hypothetical protein